MSAKVANFSTGTKTASRRTKSCMSRFLSGIDRDAEARVRNIGKEHARKAGLTEAEIMLRFADD